MASFLFERMALFLACFSSFRCASVSSMLPSFFVSICSLSFFFAPERRAAPSAPSFFWIFALVATLAAPSALVLSSRSTVNAVLKVTKAHGSLKPVQEATALEQKAEALRAEALNLKKFTKAVVTGWVWDEARSVPEYRSRLPNTSWRIWRIRYLETCKNTSNLKI